MKTTKPNYKNAECEGHNFKNGPIIVLDDNGNRTYFETSDGFWVKRKFDSKNQETYFENSNELWEIREYDHNGNEIFFKNSRGYWGIYAYENNKLVNAVNSND